MTWLLLVACFFGFHNYHRPTYIATMYDAEGGSKRIEYEGDERRCARCGRWE